MSEDLSNEIKELLDRSQSKKEDEKGDQGASAGITMGDIVGNSGTVVIGGNVNQGRREEDRPGAGDGSHGRRASDRALHQEVRSLRQQVQALKQMITELYERCTVNAFKQPAPCQAPCRATTGTPAPSTANVANRHTPASDARHMPKPAPPVASAHLNPRQPTLTRLFHSFWPLTLGPGRGDGGPVGGVERRDTADRRRAGSPRCRFSAGDAAPAHEPHHEGGTVGGPSVRSRRKRMADRLQFPSR